MSAKRKQQIFIGICLLIISALVIALASSGMTPMERDITPILFTVPTGLYLIHTKEIVIN